MRFFTYNKNISIGDCLAHNILYDFYNPPRTFQIILPYPYCVLNFVFYNISFAIHAQASASARAW